MKTLLKALLCLIVILACAVSAFAQQNLPIVGTAQTGSNNILPDGFMFPNTGAAIDLTLYRSFSVQITPNGTISTGTIVFEGTNDNVNFFPVFLYDLGQLSATPVSSFSPTTSTPRSFGGGITFRYLRFRTSVAITGGGTVTCYTNLSTNPFVATQAGAGGTNSIITGSGTSGSPSSGVVSVVQPDFTGNANITTQNLNLNSGAPTAGSWAGFTSLNNAGTFTFSVSGTWTGTLIAQVTQDGTNWINSPEILNWGTNVSSSTVSSGTTGVFQVGTEGFVGARVTMSTAATGTAVVTCIVATSDSSVSIDSPIGQQAAAQSISMALANEDVQDQNITGQSGQIAAINNIIPAIAGTNATDCNGYRMISIELIPNGTVTSGVVSMEGSNDNVNFVAINVNNLAVINVGPVSNISISTGSNFVYTGPIFTRYVRARISTPIGGGGSVQAFTRLSQTTPSYQILSNLNQVAGSTAVTAGVNGMLAVGGNVAPGSAPTSNPVYVGGKAFITVGSGGFGNGSTEAFPFTGDSQLIVHDDGDPSNEWSATSGTTPLTTNSQTQLQAAQSAGIRTYATSAQFYNTSATVSTTVSIQDGSTVIWTGYLPATTAALPIEPINVIFKTPLKGTAGTAFNLILGTTSASVYYNVQGFHNN